MTWRVPPYDVAVDEIERHVRATYKVHGICVAGSIVRGEAHPLSDFDIFIVHAEPWRLRDQKFFNGVPTELFVNPPDRIRGYFKSEHGEGRPTTAHMLATGELLAGADDIAHELVREAHDWVKRQPELSESQLTSKRYAIVDWLDNARDVIETDHATAHLLLANAVFEMADYVFFHRRIQLPRRKDLVRTLATVDEIAADYVRAFVTANRDVQLTIASALAKHVLGVDTFFEWTSDRS
jgi:hypothetical protein